MDHLTPAERKAAVAALNDASAHQQARARKFLNEGLEDLAGQRIQLITVLEAAAIKIANPPDIITTLIGLHSDN